MGHKDPNDEMDFRVTSVGKTGIAETRKIKGWRKARERYTMLIGLPHMRYVIVVNVSDRDPEDWTIRDEWIASRGNITGWREPA